MCGIVGYFNREPNKNIIKKMSVPLKQRGPDEYGEFSSDDGCLFLAHRRLAIQDITDGGSQPMKSHCGRFVIIFNGEIYNFNELKIELELDTSIFWRGHSDTEVLIECIAQWGLNTTLSKLNGMFSFALFDRVKNNLTLARDRFGEKPLYIYSSLNSFAFSSELKPIELFTNSLTINESAVQAQLQYSYIPAPYSIYNEVFKLLPGHFVEIDLVSYTKVSLDNIKPYWEVREAVQKGLAMRRNFKCLGDAIEETEKVLLKSVKQRMISDVPIGAFLSGGIDSTCITALMQENASNPIKTFSIGFNDDNYNEAHHAKEVANILGTEHNEMYLCPNDMLEFVPKLADIYDEPFADSSQLPTLMVSKFAREQVTVALTGDAGDEVFSGYNRYLHGPKLVNSYSKYPQALRSCIGSTVQSISPLTYNKFAVALSKLIPKLKRYKRVGDNIHKLAGVIDFIDEKDLYKKLIIAWPDSAMSDEVIDISTDIQEAFNFEGISLAERMMWQDTIGYMQNDILTKVDRASMASSLETRVPFLDNDVYQHSWALPLEFKIHNGLTKYPLRKLISKYIPNHIMNRPKSGFGVPIDSWLRKELKGWGEELLSTQSLAKSGLFQIKMIQELWNKHQSGSINAQYALWNVLMFQQWLTREK